jgi:hypothetical protein
MRATFVFALCVLLLGGCVSLSDPWKVAAGQSEGFDIRGPKITRLADGNVECAGTAEEKCVLKQVKGGPLSDGIVGVLADVLKFLIPGG